MRILAEKWVDGFLDYSLGPGQCRIKVRLWKNLAPIKGLYYQRPRSWRLVFNYLREVGPTQVARKVSSRLRETLRNSKYVSVGLGEVLECGAGCNLRTSQWVVFLAPCHPKCVERLTLPEGLVKAVELPGIVGELPEGYIIFREEGPGQRVPSSCSALAGWSAFSGQPLPADELRVLLAEVEKLIQGVDRSPGIKLAIEPPSPVTETDTRAGGASPADLKAAILGYGHYAKSVIIPNLAQRLSVVKVHEIDPCQLGPAKSWRFSVDSSPGPRRSDGIDVYFVAGFHHTHGPIATRVLRGGAIAVVEKPLATTFEQLDALLEAMEESPGKLFSGFHKRYSALNRLAIRDLGVTPGEPISYHCIVYEVSLPPLHWYRWPNSGSKIISNACHWVDHFLFLNDFASARCSEVLEGANGDLLICVELSNGAAFSMALTEQGSSRIGVQEYVELRARDATVSIRNGCIYTAEDSRRIIRRSRTNKASAYESMYRAISRRIADGLPGDSVESVDRSCRLVLMLEEKLKSRRKCTGNDAWPVSGGAG